MNLRRIALRMMPFVLVAPLLAQSVAARAETIYFGPWSIISTLYSNTWDTPSYVTSGHTGGCLTVTSDNADTAEFDGWGFQIIWYDGGKDKVLWSSPEYDPPANLPAQKCAPTLTVGSGEKVYEAITVYGGTVTSSAAAEGEYYVDTY